MHGDVGLPFPIADLEYWTDIRMLDPGLMLGFQHESPREFWIVPAEKLQSHSPLQARIEGRENPSEAALRHETKILVVLPTREGERLPHPLSLFLVCCSGICEVLPKVPPILRAIGVRSGLWGVLRACRSRGSRCLGPIPRGMPGNSLQHFDIGLIKRALVHQGVEKVHIIDRSRFLNGFRKEQTAHHRHAYDASLSLLVHLASNILGFL